MPLIESWICSLLVDYWGGFLGTVYLLTLLRESVLANRYTVPGFGRTLRSQVDEYEQTTFSEAHD